MNSSNIQNYLLYDIKNFNTINIDNKNIPDLRVVSKDLKEVEIKFPLFVDVPEKSFFTRIEKKNYLINKKLIDKLNIKKIKSNSSKLILKGVFGQEMTCLLDQEIQKRENVSILDLGCGNGENEEIFQNLGASNIILTDYFSKKAHILSDVHLLPFKDSCFDIVFTSQAIEHFYNPFLAFKEISRILKKDGVLIASASFMERWHGNSFFHCSPNALYALCKINNLQVENFWYTKSGWMDLMNTDIIFKNKRVANFIYYISDRIYEIVKKKKPDFLKKIITSQCFGFLAKKSYLSDKNISDNRVERYSRTVK